MIHILWLCLTNTLSSKIIQWCTFISWKSWFVLLKNSHCKSAHPLIFIKIYSPEIIFTSKIIQRCTFISRKNFIRFPEKISCFTIKIDKCLIKTVRSTNFLFRLFDWRILFGKLFDRGLMVHCCFKLIFYHRIFFNDAHLFQEKLNWLY